MLALIKNLFIRKDPPISDYETLTRYIKENAAIISGEIVMKYSLKRLGKLHFKMVLNDDYSGELVVAQAKIHRLVIADLGSIVLSVISGKKYRDPLNKDLNRFHADYLASVPERFSDKIPAMSQPVEAIVLDMKIIAERTGTTINSCLPMIENLTGNTEMIFRNQIRLVYIEFLRRLKINLTKGNFPDLKNPLNA